VKLADYASLGPTSGLQNDPKNLPTIGQGLIWNGSCWVPGNLASSVSGTPVAVGSLPSAATLGAGARAFVNNALAPTFGATVAAGGAVKVPVYSDGTNWKVG